MKEDMTPMFGTKRCSVRVSKGDIVRIAVLSTLAAGMGWSAIPAAAQQPGQKTFSSATEASKSLVEALKAGDQPALLNILGPDSKNILSSGDAAEDKNERADFVQKYQQMHRLVNEPDGKTTLYIGAENWPTPIPLVQKNGAWYFDTSAGKQEILYRRIGKNELAVIQLCHELVDAQKEYYAKPHDGDSGKHYAEKFYSDPNKHNGLYWKPVSGEGDSPIGPLVASAADTSQADRKPQPFMGYYFRLLTGKEANASGDSQGFAFVAYPDQYRSSGVMTFIVNQDGIVYEKDLGRRTAEIAKTIVQDNRDATWRKAN
jgi:hypothetical protein